MCWGSPCIIIQSSEPPSSRYYDAPCIEKDTEAFTSSPGAGQAQALIVESRAEFSGVLAVTNGRESSPHLKASSLSEGEAWAGEEVMASAVSPRENQTGIRKPILRVACHHSLRLSQEKILSSSKSGRHITTRPSQGPKVTAQAKVYCKLRRPPWSSTEPSAGTQQLGLFQNTETHPEGKQSTKSWLQETKHAYWALLILVEVVVTLERREGL